MISKNCRNRHILIFINIQSKGNSEERTLAKSHLTTSCHKKFQYSRWQISATGIDDALPREASTAGIFQKPYILFSMQQLIGQLDTDQCVTRRVEEEVKKI